MRLRAVERVAVVEQLLGPVVVGQQHAVVRLDRLVAEQLVGPVVEHHAVNPVDTVHQHLADPGEQQLQQLQVTAVGPGPAPRAGPAFLLRKDRPVVQ